MIRNHDVKVRLSPEEKLKLKKKSSKLGLTVSQYIRMVSLNANTKIEEGKK